MKVGGLVIYHRSVLMKVEVLSATLLKPVFVMTCTYIEENGMVQLMKRDSYCLYRLKLEV